MYKLVISDDEGKTTVVPLVRDEITIGRKEGNTIRLTERNVSRRHAKLAKRNGAFLIEDLGSYNGVRINGRRVEAESDLKAGDQVAIGDYIIAIQSDVAEQSEPTINTQRTIETAPPARLVMLTPPTPGAEFGLRDGMRLGRAEDLEVWVNHRSISREHALVKVDGGLVKLHDLGSANGMRLNADEVTECILSSGDIVELGQVRFRFVAAGEQYVFEADRTVQMAEPVGAEEGSRMPVVAAMAIILVAIIAGAVIALGGDGGGGDVIIEELPTNNPADIAQGHAASCRRALSEGDLESAIDHADRGLRVLAGHSSSRSCKRAAEVEREHRRQLADALARLDDDSVDKGRRVDEAFFDVFGGGIPEGHALLESEEAQRVCRAYYDYHLAETRQASSRAERQEHAAKAENAPCITDAEQRAARSASSVRRAPRPRRVSRMNTPAPMVTPAMTAAQETETPEPDAPASASEVLRECDFDQSCLVERLRGRANTPQLANTLIEAYRVQRNTPAMRREMERFIQRWPNHRLARQYERQLGN